VFSKVARKPGSPSLLAADYIAAVANSEHRAFSLLCAPAVDDTAAAGGRLEAVVPLPFLERTLGLTLGRDVDTPKKLAKALAVQ
jgi:glucosamine 6-phosphate synthetase-like amidotransferase/phosphosugar isomerase protein